MNELSCFVQNSEDQIKSYVTSASYPHCGGIQSLSSSHLDQSIDAFPGGLNL
uniref:Uncharacterized protein n=1 Tax=Arundo donax TaxID=35708 RepID=A0A0A9C187_ARUDO